MSWFFIGLCIGKEWRMADAFQMFDRMVERGVLLGREYGRCTSDVR